MVVPNITPDTEPDNPDEPGRRPPWWRRAAGWAARRAADLQRLIDRRRYRG